MYINFLILTVNCNSVWFQIFWIKDFHFIFKDPMLSSFFFFFNMRGKSGSSSESWQVWDKNMREMNMGALKMHRWGFESSAFNNGIPSDKWGLGMEGESCIIGCAVCPCSIKMGTSVVIFMGTLSSLLCIPVASHFVFIHMEILSHFQPPKLGRFDFTRLFLFSIQPILYLWLFLQ